MKAKSWKKFVKKKDEEEEKKGPGGVASLASLFLDADQETAPVTDSLPSLESIAEENDTLRGLLAERQALENQMARLTGQDGSSFLNDPRFALGYFPSMEERRKEGKEWEARHEQQLEQTRNRGRSRSHPSTPGVPSVGPVPSGISDVGPEVNDQRYQDRLKAEQARFTKITEPEGGEGSMDAFVKRRDQSVQKFQKAQQAKDMAEGKMGSATDKLRHAKGKADDKLDAWVARRDEMADKFRNVKKKAEPVVRSVRKGLDTVDGTLDKLDQALDKVDEAGMSNDPMARKLRSVSDKTRNVTEKVRNNPLKEGWDAARDKKRELTSARQKYENRINKVLGVDVGSLDELGARQEALRQQALERKKAERQAEKKEEEKREERRRKKKDRF